MIDYINKDKTGFSFFLNQILLLFSILFLGSSCFEGLIKDESKKPYEYNYYQYTQATNFDHQMKLLHKKLKDDFEKCSENKNLKVESPLNIEKSHRIGKKVEVHSLSEEEKEDLQKAIEESKRTAALEERKRDALYINSVREQLNELQRKAINIEHIQYETVAIEN